MACHRCLITRFCSSRSPLRQLANARTFEAVLSASHHRYPARAPWASSRASPASSFAGAVQGSSKRTLTAMSMVKRPQTSALFFPEQYPEVRFDEADALSSSSDLLVVVVPQDAFSGGSGEGEEGDQEGEPSPVELGSALTDLDSSKFGGLLAAMVAANDFKAKEGSVAVGPWIGGSAKSVALTVIGKPDKNGSSRAALKAVGKLVASTAGAAKFQTARVLLWRQNGAAELSAEDFEGLANGIVLSGAVAISLTKKDAAEKKQSKALERVFVHAPGQNPDQLKAGAAFAKGTLLARYLVDAPPNICTPSHLAEAARRVQESASDVFSLEVLEKEECREMGLYLGVAECSEEDPKFIHLTYGSPGDGERKVIGLVGKGLTFDSGGYNLKAGAGSLIELMKFDMGGAAAVLGAAMAIGQVKPPGLEIHFISASCENMVSGRGMRPGDVLSSANGKTVEVNNTDAEGRLTLADALWFAQEKCGVTKVVDIATLTGACMVALGTEIAGLFTPDQDLSDALVAASDASGEKIWPMPMHEAYWKQMKSQIADMKNTGGRMGGAITASLFLKQYVDFKQTSWAHIDIAGPAWDEKLGRATGFGAELLAKWVMSEADR